MKITGFESNNELLSVIGSRVKDFRIGDYIIVAIMAVLAFVAFAAGDPAPVHAAERSITDNEGRTYKNIDEVEDVINEAPDGSTMEFTFEGDFTERDTDIVISNNVNVTIESGENTTAIRTTLVKTGSGALTLVKGNGDFALIGSVSALNGRLDIDGVTIESMEGSSAIYIRGEDNAVNATVNHADITSAGTGIHVMGNKAKIEAIMNSNVKGRHGMEVYLGADIGVIDKCTIEGSYYGMRVQAGHDNSTIFTEENNANIDIGSITNSTVQVVKLPDETEADESNPNFTALAITSWAFGETNVNVGLIDNCIISTDATNSGKGALGLYSYSDFKDKPDRGKVRVDTISNCDIDGYGGSCGIFNQSAEIGEIIDTESNAVKYGSALDIETCAYANGNDPNIRKNCCGHIGLIKGGKYTASGPEGGSGIYSSTSADETPTIGKIDSVEIQANRIGINLYHNTGNIGEIVDSTIKQTGEVELKPNTAYWTSYAGIVINKSDGNDEDHIHIGNISNTKIDTRAHGIYVGSYNRIGGISNSEIRSRFEGIYNAGYSYVGDVTDTIFESQFGMGDADPKAWYGVDGTCIQNYGRFGNIKDCEMTTHGGVGISQRSFNKKGYIEKIENVTIKDVTEEGGRAGIYSEGSATPVLLIGNCTIENYATGIRNFTGIDVIKDCSITDVGVGIRTSAEIMEMEWGEHFKGDIGELSGNRIVSKNQALLVTRGGSVEEIKSGWYENTAGDNEDSRKSLSITGSESEVSTVSGGTFVGSGDSVYIDEGSLGTIIGSLDRFPVFYGKNGYAINNEKEASKINIEPNLSKETIGYARYLGTKDRQIINTPEKDTYPIHDRASETYFMSRIATDSAVKGLEGKPFHYLTVYVYLDYDKNAKDATGDMTGEIQKVEAGTQVTVGDNKFARTGYKFLNWDTDPAGIAYDPKDKLVLLEDTTFYAKWTAIKYDVSYQNLKGASNSNPTTYTYNDTSITLQPPTDPTGYTFEGWYDNSSFSGNAITAIPANSTGDKTFYAKWMAVKYDISYQNLNGASNSNPATYTIEDATITLVPPTGATGYIFEGWYDNDTFSGKVIEEIPANSTGNKTFYAKWTAIKYDVSYQNLNGASNSNPATYTIADTPLTLADLTGGPTGYTFDGWYDDATFSGPPITAIPAGSTGNKTFYAKWTADIYNISYQNLNGASNSNPTTYTVADTITLAALPNVTGYTFDGWYDNATFSGSPVTGVTVNSTGDKTFYAKWTADTYNISYQNLKGASNSNPATYTIDDTPLTLVSPTGAKGYTFDGWYDNADLSGSPITAISAGITGDLTFYAKWTEISYYNAKGNGGEWTKGSGSALTFIFKRSVDDEKTFDHFIGIEVDGKAVPEKDASGKANWTAKSGSVIIELQSSYLETLSVGEHKLAVQFDDGADATATFTVKAKPATPTVTPTKTPTKAATTSGKAKTTAATTSGKATTTAPKTGDESNMLLWFLLICASLFVLFRIISLRNRRFYDR